MKYVIGVDGGNTKTDYFLFGTDGEYVDGLRDGTCSHEVVGFEFAEAMLNEKIGILLERNNLAVSDLAAGAFGLAGVDNWKQKKRFEEIIGRMGLPAFEVDNDSFLGIMAGTTNGVGLSSINGTGTAAGGIDRNGKRLQVGGIGDLVGDAGGGVYIAECGVKMVYDSYFRCGKKTVMSEQIFKILGITDPGDLLCAIAEKEHLLGSTDVTRIVFNSAKAGDSAALEILSTCAFELAKSCAGCARNLDFEREIEVVLIGTVWRKAECPAMLEHFKVYMEKFLPKHKLIFHVLGAPPVTGAVLWALMISGCDPFGNRLREKVVSAVRKFD